MGTDPKRRSSQTLAALHSASRLEYEHKLESATPMVRDGDGLLVTNVAGQPRLPKDPKVTGSITLVGSRSHSQTTIVVFLHHGVHYTT